MWTAVKPPLAFSPLPQRPAAFRRSSNRPGIGAFKSHTNRSQTAFPPKKNESGVFRPKKLHRLGAKNLSDRIEGGESQALVADTRWRENGDVSKNGGLFKNGALFENGGIFENGLKGCLLGLPLYGSLFFPGASLAEDDSSEAVLSVLFFVALVGLVVVTAGVLYLSYTSWADNRQESKDREGFDARQKYEEEIKKFAPSSAKKKKKVVKRSTAKGFGKP